MSSTTLAALGMTSLAVVLAPMSAASAPWPSDAGAGVAMPPKPEVVILQNHVTGRCLDLPGAGLGKRLGPVEQWLCRPGIDDNQRFVMLPQGRHGAYERFLLQNQKDGFCLDLPTAGKVPSGTKLREDRCLVADNQAWYRVPVRGNAWLLVNEKSRLCLDVVGSKSRKLRTPLAVATCSMTDDHVWRMRPPLKTKVDPLPGAKPASSPAPKATPKPAPKATPKG